MDRPDKPGPSKAGDPPEAAHASAEASTSRGPGMKKATTLSEWQLQAVLSKANLSQYYQTFIDLGGDDIDQIMQSDETEFLEIMSLVGMASKPLHVRRLQRTLSEFSGNRFLFLQERVAFIGPPPVEAVVPSSSTMDNVSATIQYLQANAIPMSANFGALGLHSLISRPLRESSASAGPSLTPSTVPLPSPSRLLLSWAQTAGPSTSALGREVVRSPSQPTLTIPADLKDDLSRVAYDVTLTESDMTTLQRIVIETMKNEPVEPIRETKRQVQKHRALLEVIQMPEDHPNRIQEFRKHSAIYGRFDAKRNPEKPLTLHEILINEAAAQICLLQPSMLTWRDRLFTLARKIVREAGFPSIRAIKVEDRRFLHGERSTTPQSGLSNRSGCSTPTPDDIAVTRSHTASVEPAEDEDPAPKRPRPSSSPSRPKEAQ